ncbi:hypothetical protein BGZ65_008912, partial [Modicella reniformis]
RSQRGMAGAKHEEKATSNQQEQGNPGVSNTSHRLFRLKLVDELVELSYKVEKPQETLDNNDTRVNRPLKRSRSKTYITTNNNMLSKKRLHPGMHYPVQIAEGEDSDKENRPNQDKLNRMQ